MRCGSVCGRESARITLRKKKHPEPPLSHILAYPMAANMAGSGAQRNGSTRVSASVGSERMGDCGGERGERYGRLRAHHRREVTVSPHFAFGVV